MERNCYIIAEAGLNHNGSIDLAKKLIDLASVAGADAVKFQKRTVNKLTTEDFLNAEDNRFPSFGKTYREIREHLEFSEIDYKILKKYKKSKNLDFIVTAFDIEAYDFLFKLGVDKFKFASHSLTNLDLLKYASKKKIPVILSTGMSEMEEIDTAINIFKSNNCPVSIMHCVSSYPTPQNECNLSFINILKERYNVQTGYSGHEIGYFPTLLAVANGAEIIERHYTLDTSMEGFDHKMSLNPNDFNDMISKIREILHIFGNGQKKVSETEMITRNKYHVSMISIREIKKGEILSEDMIEYRNPGTGIPPKKASLVLGKKAKEDISNNSILNYEMFI